MGCGWIWAPAITKPLVPRNSYLLVQVRTLIVRRAFARNAGAGRGVRRRETPVPRFVVLAVQVPVEVPYSAFRGFASAMLSDATTVAIGARAGAPRRSGGF